MQQLRFRILSQSQRSFAFELSAPLCLLRILSQSQRSFAFELSAPLCLRALLLCAAVVAMASLGHPEHFQSEGALNLVRNLLR